jgi:hypothetical protein
MPTRVIFRQSRTALKGLSTIAVGVLLMIAAAAQENKPVDLPNGPAKPGFDIARFSNAGNGWFETFYVTTAEPLRDVLQAERVAEDTRLLVTNTKTGRLALLMDQMAFHHLAQGHAGDKDWMATF